MIKYTSFTLQSLKRSSILLGTAALTCVALTGTAQAEDFLITSGTMTNHENIVDGDDTITVTGELVTSGGERGIYTTGGTNEVSVSEAGSVTTSGGLYAYGVYNSGADNVTTVLGTITTSYTGSTGVYNYGDDNTTTLSGSIFTNGHHSEGISERGEGNTTNVSGNITTTTTASVGIAGMGNKNSTTLSGSISTEGTYFTRMGGEYAARGIDYYGNENSVIISSEGNITTTGERGHGVVFEGNTNETSVSGSITTAGDDAYGIYVKGNFNKIAVSGSITTTGTSAYGIVHNGDSNTAAISGTVKSTGASSTALYSESGSGNSFTLNEGAIIIGDIIADDDATNSKLIFNLGASNSYAYSVSGLGADTGGGQWTFSDLDGRSQTVTTSGTGCATITDANNTVCNLVTAVGAGNAEVQNELQYITNSSLIESLRFDAPLSTSEDGTASKALWVKTYGVSTKRDASTTDPTGVMLDATTYGITVGKPIVLGESLDLDLVFNTSKTALDIGASKDQKITTESFNFGVVMNDLASSSNWDVDAFGFVGRNSYDGKRKVMNNQVSTGFETVTASYSSTEILVGFDADFTNPISESVNFKGGINANLSSEMIGAYSESKYSTWAARTLSQVATGISAGIAHNSDALTTFVNLGADYSSLLSGKKASFTNNGTATSYTDNNAEDIHSIAAVGFDYVGGNGVLFAGSIKRSSSNKGLSSTTASLSLNSKF